MGHFLSVKSFVRRIAAISLLRNINNCIMIHDMCVNSRIVTLETHTTFLFAGMNTDQPPSDKLVEMMTDIRNIQEIITKFKTMQVDPTEFACLKGIVLFKTCK